MDGYIDIESNVIGDINLLEEALIELVGDIDPFRVERFPDDWQSYLRDELMNCNGAVLLSLREMSAVSHSESGSKFSFRIEYVLLSRSMRDVDSHESGYRIVESLINSIHGKQFSWNRTHYMSNVQRCVFVDKMDEFHVWAVRSEVKPLLSI